MLSIYFIMGIIILALSVRVMTLQDRLDQLKKGFGCKSRLVVQPNHETTDREKKHPAERQYVPSGARTWKIDMASLGINEKFIDKEADQ
jgi:hypothetical protein